MAAWPVKEEKEEEQAVKHGTPNKKQLHHALPCILLLGGDAWASKQAPTSLAASSTPAALGAPPLLLRFRRLNIQAGTQFCDSEFTKEVASGRLSASSLERYTCVALAGVVTEYLRFGQAEGGLGDVLQLDAMFRALQVRAAGQGTAESVPGRAVAPHGL